MSAPEEITPAMALAALVSEALRLSALERLPEARDALASCCDSLAAGHELSWSEVGALQRRLISAGAKIEQTPDWEAIWAGSAQPERAQPRSAGELPDLPESLLGARNG